MSRRISQVFIGIATLVATLVAPAGSEAQSINESRLNLATANVQMIRNTSQPRVKAPANHRASSLRKRIVMGAVIGTIGGMVAGIPLYRYCSNEGGSGCGRIPLYFGALGAGVGVAIGAGR
jgi:hypothetical protein